MTGEMTADYLVERCERCGMLNIVHRNKADGCRCADCAGGPLVPMGYAILQQAPASEITVEVHVKRNQLDRLIDDVAAVQESMDRMIVKTNKLREEMEHDGGVYKGAPEGTPALWYCNPEHNTECDK